MTDQVLAAARSWIGTPYRHQGRRKGAGCDCLGLVLGVWAQVYGDFPEPIPAYSPDWAEPQGIEVLLTTALRHLKQRPLGDPGHPGDLIVFRMRDASIAKHLGLQARIGDSSSFVHAYSGHGVVECALTRPWARRVAARFMFP